MWRISTASSNVFQDVVEIVECFVAIGDLKGMIASG
jgi:hypothetical protein